MDKKEFLSSIGCFVLAFMFGIVGLMTYQRYRAEDDFSKHNVHASATINSIKRYRAGKSSYATLDLTYKHPVMNIPCRTVIDIGDDPDLAVSGRFDIVPRRGSCANPIVPPTIGAIVLFAICTFLFGFKPLVSWVRWLRRTETGEPRLHR